MAGKVFFVTGLFADEDDFSAPGAFAEHGLRASFPKIAAFAVGRGFAKSFQAFAFGQKICRRSVRFVFTHKSESVVRICLVQT